jgi:hypothetical protein
LKDGGTQGNLQTVSVLQTVSEKLKVNALAGAAQKSPREYDDSEA